MVRECGGVARTGVLSDEAWARIEPLLPSSVRRRGGRWRNHPQVIEGIAWRYRTGGPWRGGDAGGVPGLGPGRVGSRPDGLAADKPYSHPSTRRMLRRRGIRATIPERSDQEALRRARGAAGGRPVAFDIEAYKGRSVVERF